MSNNLPQIARRIIDYQCRSVQKGKQKKSEQGGALNKGCYIFT